MKEYTTSELAKQLETTPTTVIRYIKKLKLNVKRETDERKNQVRKITERQAKAIEKAINSENKSSSKPSKSAGNKEDDLPISPVALRYIETLENQLKEKDETIKTTLEKLDNQQRLSSQLQDRVLMLNAPTTIPEEIISANKNKPFYSLLIGITIVVLLVLTYLILDTYNIPTWVIENL